MPENDAVIARADILRCQHEFALLSVSNSPRTTRAVWRKYPARTPIVVPSAIEISMATTPTDSDTCPAAMT